MEDTVYLQRLGERIVELRKAKGITQQELAERLGTKNTQVRRIERGTVNSTINMLRKIAVELEIPISDLVNFE
jgi:transcriptional regulator with XRE-family HTH domain